MNIEDRYWAKVRLGAPNECWPWTGFCQPKGYGTFRGEPGTTRLAHRWAFEHFVRPLTPDEKVCHTCDNPPCQNPAHWFIGTYADNNRDRDSKGRQVSPRMKGQTNGRAKISDDQASEIIRLHRASGVTYSSLAQQFGLHPTTVSLIVRGLRRA